MPLWLGTRVLAGLRWRVSCKSLEGQAHGGAHIYRSSETLTWVRSYRIRADSVRFENL